MTPPVPHPDNYSPDSGQESTLQTTTKDDSADMYGWRSDCTAVLTDEELDEWLDEIFGKITSARNAFTQPR